MSHYVHTMALSDLLLEHDITSSDLSGFCPSDISGATCAVVILAACPKTRITIRPSTLDGSKVTIPHYSDILVGFDPDVHSVTGNHAPMPVVVSHSAPLPMGCLPLLHIIATTKTPGTGITAIFAELDQTGRNLLHTATYIAVKGNGITTLAAGGAFIRFLQQTNHNINGNPQN